MSNSTILFSIRPKYAKKMFNRTKTVELRRTCPKLKEGEWVLVYVSSPVKALSGAFKVDHVLETSLHDLWVKVKHRAGISREEFDTYYEGASRGFGIFVSDICVLPKPVELLRLRELYPRFQPPQSFRYLKKDEIDTDLLNAITDIEESLGNEMFF